MEVAREHGYKRLKEEQLLAIYKFVTGSDVFVSVLTGFGKSTDYYLPSLIVLKDTGNQRQLLLIVSPLVSLMIDQKARFLP